MNTLRQEVRSIIVETVGPGLYEVTSPITNWVAKTGIHNGLLTVFVRHTSASLLIQENADPLVQSDLNEYFSRIAPQAPDLYQHRTEGPDDMPAHIRAALTQTHLSVPGADGGLMLGTWQGIYLFEHRARPQQRSIALHVLGD